MLRKINVFSIVNYTVLTLFGFLMLYPFIYVLVYSLNDGKDSMMGALYFFPRQFTLDNYADVFNNPRIWQAYKITLTRTVLGVFLHVSLCTLMAYALSKKTLPGRTFFTFFIFLPTIFSAGFIPYFITLQKLHLINTFWVYVIPMLYNFMHIVIIRTFLQGIPEELEESARIDGYGDFQIFLKIILPLSGPVLATIALFNGVAHWNDWFAGAYYVSDKNLLPVQTLLQEMLMEAESLASSMQRAAQQGGQTMSASTGGSTPESLRMALLVITVFPILCVYPFLQRYFVKGVMIGSVKG
ncbi:carbohydrate ABC transporter permease [Paenibacillus melissococcoides]|uniref:Carbohydrate ABC transporter permease n=1 Tax=Paenibacillus melissococcoides TaxID=2912268 RepID=A0ABN8U9Y0_9BACL|nr:MULTISPECIES: carbohydrate ABC transporter permease [Paenibacillus]MEB9896390.1 carbohydrate ABC transporter permease [Bacillus cereus]CAH8247925.1 carbohydrate ABC transporter permease [Paenibacillus melissococcoides]CAH8719133.1 carbohydrate ABC transporter permease [Paenibacillus melissococcoides]CAH8720142.1 carbohydrate ABC transporter permease [Paenibacillus melissococcoides]GIO82966.1 maltose ABC transporter permease [Paenibacillus dendritiformis]